MKTTQLVKPLQIIATALVITMCLSSPSFAEKTRDGSKQKQLSDDEQLAADYQARREAGDTATAHGYQPCRDGGRCGYWGYGGYGHGWGYGGGYWGYPGNGSSAGWSRSNWRGSDIPTAGYNQFRRK